MGCPHCTKVVDVCDDRCIHCSAKFRFCYQTFELITASNYAKCLQCSSPFQSSLDGKACWLCDGIIHRVQGHEKQTKSVENNISTSLPAHGTAKVKVKTMSRLSDDV